MNTKLIDAKIRDYDQAVADVKRDKLAMVQSTKEYEIALKSQEILQLVAQSVQERVHKRLARIVSRCLGVVYGDDAYHFQIRFERRRGKTEAKLAFVRDGLEVEPLLAAGGGCIDVAAIALRISCLALHQPRIRSLIVLDEPFRFVDPERRENVKAMLDMLSQELDCQILMVTHAPELVTGTVVELGNS